MTTEYKYVEFNQEFKHNGITYTKANHNRGKVVGERNLYKRFGKSDVVEANIEETVLTQWLKVV